MLMGAVPIIEFWSGAVGYEKGNLSTVIIHEPEELNEKNIRLWGAKFTSGNDLSKLTQSYWRDIAFNEDF